ncbi:MAG: hypothetical protein LBP22_17140 [Deltaproteobacteria bacterium]|nr:hypothetical protein [Deltaproteobacteria bacterium]
MRARIFAARQELPRLLSHHLFQFLEDPSTCGSVQETAEKLDLWPKIKSAVVVNFLETGLLPWLIEGAGISEPDRFGTDDPVGGSPESAQTQRLIRFSK